MTIETRIEQLEKESNGKKFDNQVAKVKALGLVAGLALTYVIGCASMGSEETNNFFRHAFYEMPKALVSHYIL